MKKFARLAACLLLACTGPAGPPGPPGEQGPAGARGAAAGEIDRAYYCMTTSGGDLFRHDVSVLSGGSALVSCEIHTTAQNSSSVRLIAPTQPSIATGACIVTRDVDAASGGFWLFALNASAKTSVATYTDTGGANGRTVSLPCDVFTP